MTSGAACCCAELQQSEVLLKMKSSYMRGRWGVGCHIALVLNVTSGAVNSLLE